MAELNKVLKCLWQRQICIFSMYILTALIINPIFCQTTTSTTETQVTDGQCIWYGICKTTNFGSKSIYCSYNGTAKPLQPEGLDLLNKYCPHLNQGESNTYTCCDIKQIEVMNKNIAMAEILLKKCPACFHNFVQPICDMTCSPKQSTFLKVQKIENSSDTEPYVTSIDFSMASEFQNGSYNSCSQVRAFLGVLAMDLMCDIEDSDCTAKKWFDYMGNPADNDYAPFLINYVTDPIPGLTPFNRTTVACNEALDADKGPCGCWDCSKSCPTSEK